MKIELKRIEFSERMSEETNCFAADLYVDTKKVGYVKNDGRGGATDYRPYGNEGDREAIRQAEEYCKSLPDIDYGGFTLPHTLEHHIDDLFEKWRFNHARKPVIIKQGWM